MKHVHERVRLRMPVPPAFTRTSFPVAAATRLLAVVLLVSCQEATPPCVVSAVVVSPGSVSVERDLTVQLAATPTATNCSTVPTATWTSAQVATATVSSTGLLTGVALGSTTVTATALGISGVGTVTVTQPPPATSTVTPATASFVSLGETTQLAAEAKDARGVVVPGVTFTWASSSPAVATVSASGLVTAVANGSASITATAGTVIATANMTVAQVASSLTVTPSTITLAALGATTTLSAVVKDARGNAMSATPVWTTSASGTVTVSAAGVATAIANGFSNVAATLGSVSGVSVVNVVQAVSDLVFSVQPPNGNAFAVLAPTIKASLRDARGNVATNSIAPVTLRISTNPLGGALGGTLTRSAVAGVADFTGISVTKRGTGYKLTASALGFSAASAAFNIDRSAADPGLKLTSLQIHDRAGTCVDLCTAPSATVPAGSNVVGKIVGTLWNQSSCAGCITQMVTGFGAFPSVCYSGGSPGLYPGTAISTDGTVPSPTPTATGTYLMRVRITQQFSCGAAALADYAASPPPSEEGIGYIVTTNTADYTTALTNIKLNSKVLHAVVSAGQPVALSLDYQVWNHPSCPGCVNQVVIGLNATAVDCVYDAVPGLSPGASGSKTVTLTAPTTPGTYEVRYKTHLEFSCAAAKTGFNTTPPGTGGAIGTIVVLP